VGVGFFFFFFFFFLLFSVPHKAFCEGVTIAAPAQMPDF
jgi:hypothetical protein